jgi:hypothetical protein
MTKIAKPHLTETPDGGSVEIADGVFVRWWQNDGVWSVQIRAEGLEVHDVRHEKATVSLH